MAVTDDVTYYRNFWTFKGHLLFIFSFISKHNRPFFPFPVFLHSHLNILHNFQAYFKHTYCLYIHFHVLKVLNSNKFKYFIKSNTYFHFINKSYLNLFHVYLLFLNISAYILSWNQNCEKIK